MKKIALLLLILPILCFGQVPDPIPNTYVNDLVGKLTPEQIHTLNDSILSIEKRSSVQIAIILLDKLPENMSIEDYTLEVGRKWHVGNAANGMVYAAALGSKKQRLEVARALESKITDLEAYTLTEEIKPFFRAKDYFGGLTNLLNHINEQLKPVLAQQYTLGQQELAKKKEKESSQFWLIASILFMFLAIAFIWYFDYRKRKLQEDAEREHLKWEADRQERMRQLLDSRRLEEERIRVKNLIAPKEPFVKPLSPMDIALSAGLAERIAAIKQRDKTLLDKTEDLLKKKKKKEEDDDDDDRHSSYTPPYIPTSSSSSDSSSSSSNDSSSYGNWGSGSSDSGSSSYDSGMGGGGSSNDL